MVDAVDYRLGQIETRLADIGRLFERFSEVVERMVSLEEKNHQTDRRIEIAESGIRELNGKLDTKFEKQDERYEIKFDKVYDSISKLGDKLQANTVKVLTLWGILSFVGALGAVFLKEALTKLF